MDKKESEVLKDLMEKLNDLTESLKPSETLVQRMSDCEKAIKKVRELTLKLNDPDEGVIARVKELESWKERAEQVLEYNEQQNVDLVLLKEWRGRIDKLIWLGFVTVAGLLIKALVGVVL
tara:strand:+ start:127 stop:486 length:360 start_codon:yes stop_codon:yes gene_type:complete